MLTISLITLFASVAFASYNECENPAETCEPADDYGSNITVPETAEELEAYCEYKTNFFGCLYEVLLECKNFGEANMLEKRIAVLQHICMKDTELYEDMIIILPCIKNELTARRDWQCRDLYSNELSRKKFEEFLVRAGITDVSTEHECFHKYFSDACSIGASGAVCGILGRNVALEIGGLYGEEMGDYCSVKIGEKMPDISLEMEALFIESEDVPEETEREREW